MFDAQHGHDALVCAGWIDQKRVHRSVIHIDLKGDKMWIQHDGTSMGVANDLLARGIPEGARVLAFQHTDLRVTASPSRAARGGRPPIAESSEAVAESCAVIAGGRRVIAGGPQRATTAPGR